MIGRRCGLLRHETVERGLASVVEDGKRSGRPKSRKRETVANFQLSNLLSKIKRGGYVQG